MASNNAHKVEEFQIIFSEYSIKILSLAEAGLILDVEETGSTFLENSLLKSEALYQQTEFPVIADDSGIMVDALNGEPGIYSARYAGIGATDQENRDKLLRKVKEQNLTLPTARYVCALTYQDEQHTIQVEGYCEGQIFHEERGQHGFGYDPLFYLSDFDQTAAQIAPETKNKISHRNAAIEQLLTALKSSNII